MVPSISDFQLKLFTSASQFSLYLPDVLETKYKQSPKGTETTFPIRSDPTATTAPWNPE